MIKGCKRFLKQKAVYDLDVFSNAEPIDCCVFFYISYRFFRELKKKWFYKKPHI